MGRKASFSEDLVRAAEQLVAGASTAREVKAGLSVVLSARLRLSNAKVAAVLGIGTATVARLHGEARAVAAGGGGREDAWGGRRHEYMTFDDEEAFLKPWEETAARGGVLIVQPIRTAFESRVGRPVAATTIYRLLARHGWRRIEPDNAHPKRDKEAQEAFKKGASRKAWLKR